MDETPSAFLGAPAAPPVSVAELHRTQYASVVRFLLYQRATWAEAHDAVQDAFLSACEPGALDGVRSPQAWLRTVALRSWKRRNGRSPLRLVSLSADDDTSDWQTPLLAVELSEQQKHIVALLQGLPDKQRQIMAWHLDGYSTQEIAQHMHLRETAVRKNLSRARRTLKERLGLGMEGK